MENIIRFYTKKQVAVSLQVSTRTLDRYVKAGAIKPIRIGKLIRFPENILSVDNTNQS